MRTTLQRGEITEALLDHVRTFALLPVGDAETPDDAGWSDTPGKAGAVFRPFQVVVPGPASVTEGSLASPEQDWKLPYVITTFGIGRGNTEKAADLARQHLMQMVDVYVGDWRITHVAASAIGPDVRHEGLTPKIFSQTDTVTLWVTLEGGL